MSQDQALLVDAIVGYRAFTVRQGGRLFSQYSGVEWPSFPDVTFEARCRWESYFGMIPHIGEHTAPHKDCACGIHAFHEVGSVADVVVPWEGGEAVVGLIAGWGQVVPHPDGFRCSHARICALSGTSREARAAAMNCEVRLLDRRSELPELADLFGRPLPESLVPDPKPGPSPTDHFIDRLVGITT